MPLYMKTFFYVTTSLASHIEFLIATLIAFVWRGSTLGAFGRDTVQHQTPCQFKIHIIQKP